MTTIWKFTLATIGIQILNMPTEAEILTVQMQDNAICLWARVDPANGVTQRMLEIFGTGHKMDNAPRAYIATVQVPGLVWHIYERNVVL